MSSTHPLETYLCEIREIRSTGGAKPETSYYGALGTLLNVIGGQLKPRVRCVPQLANSGAGSPDFGLYTSDQFQRGGDKPLDAKPSRGAVEVKAIEDDSFLTAQGKQVTQYWGHYGQVLVTNYRQFVLVGNDADGKTARLESYALAETPEAFRCMLAHPQKAVAEHEERLTEYLKRVLRHDAPLTDPQDVAWYLASYAKEAKARIELASNLSGLDELRESLEQALGLKFEGDEGDHFFRATLIQTLFYGIFSSWVIWARDNGSKSGNRFNWHDTGWGLHVPMIAELFERISTRSKLHPLGIDEVLDWTALALNRVDRERFFEEFEEEHAVQYFYEPFLKAYDPELRKRLGVWYTPLEIVKYQVARVDTVLREELDVADGLADPRVYVLDPCCGTGTYLIEVLNKIRETLLGRGGDALLAQRLKKDAVERIFGFEILPAPFVVAHLQLGLLLKSFGAPLDDVGRERVCVYLTNALTGWEPPAGAKKQLTIPIPEFQAEHDAADKVKREAPILVILGNPPYNAFAGTSPEEEDGLVDAYKEGLNEPICEGGWGIRKFNLDELYARFFRIAERRIVKGGKGVVCYITNFSYLSDPSFVVMRQRFLKEFDKLWFDCMNGDSRETGKLTPDGKPDPSVFSTEHNREGIRVGTAIGLMVRNEKHRAGTTVRFREFWGTNKRTALIEALQDTYPNKQYKEVAPKSETRLSFHPLTISSAYLSWPSVLQIAAEKPSNGLMEKRGGALLDLDARALEERIQAYYGPVAWEALPESLGGLLQDAGRFSARAARTKVTSAEAFDAEKVRRYALRPFDTRWCYYSTVRPLWNEPRPSLWAQCWKGNTFFLSRFLTSSSHEGTPCLFASTLSDDHILMPDASCFPMQLRHIPESQAKNAQHPELIGPVTTANLSEPARAYMARIAVIDPDKDACASSLVWMHALAISYTRSYLRENADGIRQDWPRIPLPSTRDLLEASAALGREVAALLDTETIVPGVTAGKLRSELCVIGLISHAEGGNLDPGAGHLDVTAGWGHAGQGGVTMPGKGRVVERKYTKGELDEIERGAGALGLSLKEALKYLGKATRDIYFNDTAYWRNVPEGVWEYHIGGYQVIKKWLSYRERSILGRGLKMEEADYVTDMARRLTALVLLQPRLDANYKAVKARTYKWPASAGVTQE